MTRSLRRAGLGLALACLACAPSQPTPEPQGDAWLTGRDAHVSAAAIPREHVGEGELVTHWDALVGRFVRGDALERSSLEREFHRTAALSLSLVFVREELPPPRDPADELLIVVEGETGALELAGRPFRIGAGSVALLPAGSRGRLRSGSPDHPLLALLVRSRAPSGAGRPTLADFDRLWSEREGLASNQDRLQQPPVAQLPGGLRLRALTVYGHLPPHAHRQNDEVTLVLTGDAAAGVGSSGHIVRPGSLFVVPTGAPHYLRNVEPRGTRLLVLEAGGVPTERDTEVLPAEEEQPPAPAPAPSAPPAGAGQ